MSREKVSDPQRSLWEIRKGIKTMDAGGCLGGDAGLDFFQQLVISGDFPVDVAFLGYNAPALYLAGDRPHMDGGNFINVLALMAAAVDALRLASGL